MHEHSSMGDYATSLLAGRAYALADHPLNRREEALAELVEIAAGRFEPLVRAQARLRALAVHPSADARARQALGLLTAALGRVADPAPSRRRGLMLVPGS